MFPQTLSVLQLSSINAQLQHEGKKGTTSFGLASQHSSKIVPTLYNPNCFQISQFIILAALVAVAVAADYAPKYEAPKYEAPKYEAKYEAPKYEAQKYEAPKYEAKYEEVTYVSLIQKNGN
jgi:hypothetical protein